MIFIYLIVIAILMLLVLIYISNNWLKVTKYKVKNDKLPKAFDNFKIVHISDVHGKIFGENNKDFIQKVKNINPDIIIMSGDIINQGCSDLEKFISYFKELFLNYPTYYSIGNHERHLGYNRYKKYLQLLRENNVNVIVNGSCNFVKDNENIVINALKFRENMQPKVLTKEKEQKYIKYMKGKLKDLNTNKFNILISHDPENFLMYEKLGVDLIFSGHVHGGLIRLGKVCLLSPRRKFFPKYSYGKSRKNKTTIITSSGIGDARIPIRLFNRPEIVLVTLKK